MGYATITNFRELTNISKDIISDNVLKSLFPVADRLVNKLISTPVKLEALKGNVNGTNKIFYTAHGPIADITLRNVLVVDTCDATTSWTESTDALAAVVVGKIVEGSGALALGKDGVTVTVASYSKTVTSRDGTGRRLKLALFIRNVLELAEDDAVTIRIGSAVDAYYEVILQRKDLKNGLNELDFGLTSDMRAENSPTITALVYAFIGFEVEAASDTVAIGDIQMDYWRLEDIDSPDTADVIVYYATEDSNKVRVLGSAQAVTSLLRDEGSITMTTAPTTTTAIAGVFCNYSYVSDHMDWNLVPTAAVYMAAHLASFIISGNAPNYNTIEDGFMRRDLAGAPDEWLRLCYSILANAVGEDATGIGFRRVETEEETF